MKTKLLIILLSVLIIGSSACEINKNPDKVICTEIFVYGLNITVKDDSTGTVITENVNIIATDDTYEESLIRIESSNSFFGAGERMGTYTLTITSPNYQTFISNPITVLRNECHVIPQILEFTIQQN